MATIVVPFCRNKSDVWPDWSPLQNIQNYSSDLDDCQDCQIRVGEPVSVPSSVENPIMCIPLKIYMSLTENGVVLLDVFESWRTDAENEIIYSASALLAMQSAVLARGIPSVRLSVCHVPVLCPCIPLHFNHCSLHVRCGCGVLNRCSARSWSWSRSTVTMASNWPTNERRLSWSPVHRGRTLIISSSSSTADVEGRRRLRSSNDTRCCRSSSERTCQDFSSVTACGGPRDCQRQSHYKTAADVEFRKGKFRCVPTINCNWKPASKAIAPCRNVQWRIGLYLSDFYWGVRVSTGD